MTAVGNTSGGEPIRYCDRLPARLTRNLLLTAVALAAPFLIIMGDRPVYFLAYHFHDLDLFLIGGTLCFGPWLLLLPPEVLLTPRRPHWHDLVLFALLGYFGLQIGAWSYGLDGPGLFGAAFAGAMVATPVIRRIPGSRFQLSAMLAVALVIPFWFFAVSPVSELFGFREPGLAKVEVVRPSPVFFLVFDSFPVSVLLAETGEIDAEMFPNFSALAADSRFFRNATCNVGQTAVSVPSLLTGRLPRYGRATTGVDYPDNLLRLLASTHDLRVADPYSWMAPRSGPAIRWYEPTRQERFSIILSDLRRLAPALLKSPLAQAAHTDFMRKLNRHGIKMNPDSPLWKRFERYRFFREMVAEMGDRGPRPPLFYSHLLLPHTPWTYLPDGTPIPVPSESRGVLTKMVEQNRTVVRWTRDEWTVRQGYQRVLFQARFCDRLLGEALAALKAAGLYDDAMLVVTADHGFALGPGSLVRDPVFPESPLVTSGKLAPTHQQILRVPLFMKFPGGAPQGISDENVELVDVVPTLVEVLGIESPFPREGRSLVNPEAVRRGKKAFQDFQEKVHTLPAEAVDLTDLVKSRRAWFAAGRGPTWSYRLLPYGDLVGAEVSRLRRLPIAGWSSLEHRVPAPGIVTGTLAGEVFTQGSSHLALVQNGRVVAVTRTQSLGDDRVSYLAFTDPAFKVEADGLSVHLLLGEEAGEVYLGDPTAQPRERGAS